MRYYLSNTITLREIFQKNVIKGTKSSNYFPTVKCNAEWVEPVIDDALMDFPCKQSWLDAFHVSKTHFKVQNKQFSEPPSVFYYYYPFLVHCT